MVIRPWRIGGALLFGAVAAAVFAFDPARVNIFPPCIFHRVTGLWCPGCGATRAMHQLVHGNLAAAFHFNPLAISILPVAAYLVVRGDTSTLKPSFSRSPQPFDSEAVEVAPPTLRGWL